jgi:hypothetical protein
MPTGTYAVSAAMPVRALRVAQPNLHLIQYFSCISLVSQNPEPCQLF